LNEDGAYVVSPQETTLEVNDYGRRIKVPGNKYQVVIPFEGHMGLFRHWPRVRSSMPPLAKVGEGELLLGFKGYNNTRDELDEEIGKIVSGIKQFLEWQRPEVEAGNSRIRETARSAINNRKDRILKARQIAASLRYPLCRRPDAPMVYVTPELRRKIAPTRAPASPSGRQPFQPEPTIDEAEYQHILEVMCGMALMMERSPSTFEKLEEEEIRDHFLLQLNGHYHGSATGETFNAEGKTDILVRDGNRNVFIAECKIWSGPKNFLEAIDQLVGYLTWRDTKSALVVFSRNKDFTAVLKSIRAKIEEHPHKKRGPEIERETRFRYVFGSPNDRDREIIVTVMAFSVPSPDQGVSSPS
jgi:hypothetical protein